jgi:hypothetical protein
VIALALLQAVVEPTATAFAARCEDLRRAEPSLTCARLASLRAGGHPVEVWETVRTDDLSDEPSTITAIVVVMQAQAGWYASSSFELASVRENGHHNVRRELALERVDARRAGDRAVVLIHAHLSGWCEPCEGWEQSDQELTTAITAWIGDDGAPAFTRPITAASRIVRRTRRSR